ncbi:polysaccharide deacetylase family sporulation protein PdaB [Clostridium grantii]|uniref:Polysaccharide deacetylase family sporulation protein PdaB n=1 Tax=Clostridium grantii DSM 8605 TaxID=1121316 RepID=A0A1M5VUZ8_9CLOT|nr:polysaccharide deacetylase family sporulation protein PdaB [Clostridium grantii]SHH78804.1 polysaccharide deacetylase family sporulation protein PdaB [Clostridium grantii DSM 8605]
MLKAFVKSRSTIYIALSVILILLLSISLNLKTKGVFFNTNKKLPIYCVDTEEKKVAISFDASWGANNTVKILDILDKYDVKATFFLLGRWVDQFPEETKEIYNRGHEIGNHSDTHPDMVGVPKTNIVKEINITDSKIENLTGEKTSLFRCPSGSYNNSVVEAVESTNHYCIQWDVDSIDWKEQGADLEFNRVMKKVKPGSIVLFHNAAIYTPENLPRIIEELKAQGYEFVTISDLIYKEEYYIDYSGKQIKK